MEVRAEGLVRAVPAVQREVAEGFSSPIGLVLSAAVSKVRLSSPSRMITAAKWLFHRPFMSLRFT